jgi:hypothetical protein
MAARGASRPASGTLGDALMRPGGVVVGLVLDQDGAQVRLTEDQHVAGNSRRKVPTSRAQVAFMRGAWAAVREICRGGPGRRVKGLGEVRSAVADQELDVLELPAEAARLLYGPLSGHHLLPFH